MDMSMTMTHMAPMATATAGSSMSGMSGMSGMVHNGCKISMLWNWHVINACSCIGVILLVMSLEFLRRAGYEFDKYLAGKPTICSKRCIRPRASPKSTSNGTDTTQETLLNSQKRSLRPTLIQHTARSLLHMLQFGVAYFVMLLAMYYNGYIIISILIGSFLGSFVFSWKSDEEKLVA
ncbi:hypothetical protein ACJ72_04012 [Emergomyces africanus]|uniref:Copper transport protein n=1 Tax=Emergomyces africanus TaxID=1955775 RepID=A0A1B7NXZ9_9EURO|nr:hypothetical protein ACJ72_04012 [Emergomyces africanus]